MIKTDIMRSHPNFGSALRDPRDRAALDDAWDRKWFEVDPNKETFSDTNKKACKEYKITQKALATAARLKREIAENFGGSK